MIKERKRYEMQSVGGRLKYFREKAGYTQQRLAEEIHTTRQLIALWEQNERNSYTPYIEDICKTLNIDEGSLVNGVPIENQTVSEDLGLNNDAIEFLKSLKGDYYIPFVTTDSDELDATSISENLWSSSHDYSVEIEGGYPDEMLFIINLLLSNPNGKMLLAMMYKFISIQFGNAFVNDERCYNIEYNTDNEKRKRTTIPVTLMKYSLLQAIISKLEELRENVKGEF